ncbi:hypothetical protein KUTeg_005544 [Tegillarca granosa]|uniref:Uncharacterized protein n=1 Tax=Tegillarca granosa TaxID=220873 RepID=A0ABQ9FPJ1_TEGGR|nr:hypothetical protein KUTeg_005544 [Tegillarca granosa]
MFIFCRNVYCVYLLLKSLTVFPNQSQINCNMKINNHIRFKIHILLSAVIDNTLDFSRLCCDKASMF